MQDDERVPAGAGGGREAAGAAEPEGTATEAPRQVLAYVARFDRGEFWLAHEEMEEHWQEHQEDLFKGLIQVAAGFLHAERGNWNGARRLLATALEYLEPYPGTSRGFDLKGIRKAVREAQEGIEACAAGEARRFDESLIFKMSRHYGPEVPDGVVEDEELPYRVRRYDDGYRPYGGEG